MNTEQELRRCPLCQRDVEAVQTEADYEAHREWYIECLCGIEMHDRLLSSLITRWNRRSSDEQAEVVGWAGRRGDYPLGTRALSIDGGHWTRVDGGWKWHLGDVFPSLGADAYKIEIPARPPAVAKGGVTEARAIVDEMLARDQRNGFLTDWWRIKLDALDAALPTPPSRGEGE